jgi:dienelactone hydrolase
MPCTRLEGQDRFRLNETAAGSTGLREQLKRAAYLRHLLEVYHSDDDNKPHDTPVWESWLAQSGELPPDFDALPTSALLPNVLQFSDGSPVRTHEEWSRRREEVLDVLQHYQLGKWPQPPPAMLVEELACTSDDALGGELKKVLLTYGPDEKAVRAETLVPYRDPSMFRAVSLHVDVYTPPGSGPFPAVVEVGDRRGERMITGMSARAAQRGYVVCSFDRADAFLARDVYPDCDCNQMVWWAYAASRCVDYLCGLDEVDPSKIAVIGHSRGGKMALVAAVLDERISATVASHPGAGSGQVAPWRYLGEKYGGETLESSTLSFPYWNHPRLRFFAGRENKLPFDSHFMMSLVAPRALLVSQGDTDDVGECWGAQQAYLATREVYNLLGHASRLHIVFHGGGHRLSEDAQEAYIDWLDMQFGRRPLEVSEELMYTYTFDRWREVTGEGINVADFPERGLDDLLLSNDGAVIETPDAWQGKRRSILERVRWALGDLPPLGTTTIKRLSNISHPSPGMMKAELVLEEGFVVHLTYPADADGRLPTVIFLHAYVDALGCASTSEYGWSPLVGERLAQLGFLAVEYDQFGYGSRNHDAGIEFYAERPAQSAMGVMVRDVQKVVSAVSQLEMADGDRIMVTGYSLGGTVALFATALDERVKAVASTCGFGAMRLDSHGNETEGLRRYSHLRPLLPRLGFFLGNEKRVPFDFHEILALIAPRPLFVLAPLLDQDWVFEDVEACIEPARTVYSLFGARHRLQFHTPLDFNRYPPAYQNRVNHWLLAIAECLGFPTN